MFWISTLEMVVFLHCSYFNFATMLRLPSLVFLRERQLRREYVRHLEQKEKAVLLY